VGCRRSTLGSSQVLLELSLNLWIAFQLSVAGVLAHRPKPALRVRYGGLKSALTTGTRASGQTTRMQLHQTGHGAHRDRVRAIG
jgi:hypothetical protein